MSPGIASKESIPPDYRYVKQSCSTGPPGWESIPGLLKRSTNTGSVQNLGRRILSMYKCKFYSCASVSYGFMLKIIKPAQLLHSFLEQQSPHFWRAPEITILSRSPKVQRYKGCAIKNVGNAKIITCRKVRKRHQ